MYRKIGYFIILIPECFPMQGFCYRVKFISLLAKLLFYNAVFLCYSSGVYLHGKELWKGNTKSVGLNLHAAKRPRLKGLIHTCFACILKFPICVPRRWHVSDRAKSPLGCGRESLLCASRWDYTVGKSFVCLCVCVCLSF